MLSTRLGVPEDEQQGIPFTKAVMADELTVNCCTPAITEYDSMTDPQEHLSHFENAALLHNTRTDNKPLKEYLQRFNATALEVPSATQEVKASAFSQELLEGDFFKSLAKKPIYKFDALLARATKYINMEDAQTAKKTCRGEKRKEMKEEVPSKKPRTDFRDKKSPFQRIKEYVLPNRLSSEWMSREGNQKQEVYKSREMKVASPEAFPKGGPKTTPGDRAEASDPPRKGVIRIITGGPMT
ncbi:UNVERIFIED_CONTAM: hypothetical protein Slati_1510500 [Sesamum latifolium]|uniref:Retrotransposon gag domain-containing protein n=1 Tax=Sesamum latifolium TaxID=2727402 RepID=A0AAW2X7D5_9LAMI